MKSFLFTTCIFFLFTSCSTIPEQSIELMGNVQNEGERMHKLNLSLINELFTQKQKNIDEFLVKEYIPSVTKKFSENIPTNVDVRKELPDMLSANLSVISQRRNSMQSALEKNRLKIIEKLDSDYNNYKEACFELSNLLNSAVKVNSEKMKLYKKSKELSNNQIDFEKLENSLNQFIYDTGDWSEKINNLNDSINKIIKN